MSKSKLVCTVELDLPDNLAEAHKAQGPLLEMWSQFTSALPEQGINGARIDARVVKSKEPKAEKAAGAPTPTGITADASAIPGFLKRA
jgi:hypothetical protein